MTKLEAAMFIKTINLGLLIFSLFLSTMALGEPPKFIQHPIKYPPFQLNTKSMNIASTEFINIENPGNIRFYNAVIFPDIDEWSLFRAQINLPDGSKVYSATFTYHNLPDSVYTEESPSFEIQKSAIQLPLIAGISGVLHGKTDSGLYQIFYEFDSPLIIDNDTWVYWAKVILPSRGNGFVNLNLQYTHN
jgi:hypothetical protein